jgi:glycosyltransferase involved in cell wall biosynthesis
VTRVLFVIPDLMYDHVAAQLAILLAGLPRDALRCRVCVLGKTGTPAEKLRQGGVEVDAPGRGRLFDFTVLSHLRGLVRSFHPDAVHAWGLSALRAMVVAGFKGRLVISPCPRPDVRRSWLRWIDGRLLGKARHVVALGEVEAERCRLLGVRPDQLVVAAPAVGMGETGEVVGGIPEGTRFLFCAGRLLPHKGFLDAIWALDILRYVHPDLRLVIAGEGPDRERLERFASHLDATRSLHFLGEVPAVGPLLKRAEVVWSPGRTETGTQVVLEAMALGKAVVASRWPRLAELITDGETGLLAPAEDKALLARQTQRLLTDAGLRQRLGEAARRRVQERHRPQALAETCLRLYRG